MNSLLGESEGYHANDDEERRSLFKKDKIQLTDMLSKRCDVKDFDRKDYPMCYNSCRALNDEEELTIHHGSSKRKRSYEQREPCEECKSKDVRSYYYYPIIPRLRRMLESPEKRESMRYRHNFTEERDRLHRNMEVDDMPVEDVFDGEAYKTLRNAGLFTSENDVLLGLPHDGFHFFMTKFEHAWAMCMYNYNIPPQERSKVENVLVVCLIPGPRSPKNHRSFFKYLLEELLTLQRGVECDIRGVGQVMFRAHLLCLPSDIAEASWILGTKDGSNCVAPCRYCTIVGCPVSKPQTADKEGVRHVGTYYYPGAAPTNYSDDFKRKITRKYVELYRNAQLDDNPLVYERKLVAVDKEGNRDIDLHRLNNQQSMIRDHDKYMEQWELIDQEHPDRRKRLKKKESLQKLMGLNEKSDFYLLISVQLLAPYCCPPDLMHYIPNVCELMVTEVWPDKLRQGASEDMTRILKAAVIPGAGAWGRWPKRCFENPGSLKKEEWISFVLCLSPILLKDAFINVVHYDGWMHFVRMCRLMLCRKEERGYAAYDKIQMESDAFMRYYEAHVYGGKEENLSLCRLNIHYTHHLPESFRQLGFGWLYWQNSMENMVGILKRLIFSPTHPYVNLANVVRAMELLKDVRVRHGLLSLRSLRLLNDMEIRLKGLTFGDSGEGTHAPLYMACEMGNFRCENNETAMTPGFFMPLRLFVENMPFEGMSLNRPNLPIRLAHFQRLLFRYYRDQLQVEVPPGMTLKEMIAAERLIAYGKYVVHINAAQEPDEGITTEEDFKEWFRRGGKTVTCTSLLIEQNLRDRRCWRGQRTRQRNSSFVAIENLSPSGQHVLYYAQALFYLAHKIAGRTRMLACVQWTDNQGEGPQQERGLPYFIIRDDPDRSQEVSSVRTASGYIEVIAVRSIKRPVAILRKGRTCYIVDKHAILPGFVDKRVDELVCHE